MDKHLAPYCILEILKQHSSEHKSLEQEQIRQYLLEEYDIDLERKAIGRNLDLLASNFPDTVVKGRRGSYYDHQNSKSYFDDAELRLLIDSILSSKYINVRQSKELIERLCALSGGQVKPYLARLHTVKNYSKTDNSALFYNIDIINEAISCDYQITFDYNRYGVDKKLHPIGRFVVSPYQLAYANGRYYLLAITEGSEDLRHFKVDLISAIEMTADHREPPLETVIGDEELPAYLDEHPYMLPGNALRVRMLVKSEQIGEVIDAFGMNLTVMNYAGNETDDTVCVSFKATEEEVFRWSLQHADCAEVLSPQSLRDRIRAVSDMLAERYR